MAEHQGLTLYVIWIAAANVVGAAIVALRPVETANANRDFIDSGKESYFEQRRAWKAYGTTPETDPYRLRRRALIWLAINVAVVGAILLMSRAR